MSGKDRVLVYSTDPRDQALISGEADRQKQAESQKALAESGKFTVVFRLETQSRGGKTVTVLDRLPAYEPFVKELTKELKTKCGTGGSYRFGEPDRAGVRHALIEIQGDKREAVKKILDTKQIKYKGM